MYGHRMLHACLGRFGFNIRDNIALVRLMAVCDFVHLVRGTGDSVVVTAPVATDATARFCFADT